MGSDTAPVGATRRQCLPVVGAMTAIAVVLWRVVPEGTVGAQDHFTYLRTVEYMRQGADYFTAMRDAFGDLGTTLGHARAYRLPGIFLFWRLFPTSWLFGAFVVVVVLGTTYLLARASKTPWAALPVGLYLMAAGRIPWAEAGAFRETWALVEYWTVPLLAGGLLCWRRRQWWWAAALITLAALTREVTAPLLLGGLLAAHVGRLPRRPWFVGVATFSALFAAHLWVAGHHLDPPGNDAVLLGTGAPPGTVLDMTAWVVPGGVVVGLVLWLGAVERLYRRDRLELVFMAPLLLLPLTGLLVDRAYWGIVVVPFTLFYSAELVGQIVAERRPTPPQAAPADGPVSSVA